MKAEIIAIGTELLMGDVVNSNAAWLSRELATLGIDVHYHITVGDNPERIQGVIRQAISRSDLLIFTGGLGPTMDDLTVATIADYFQTPLTTDSQSADTIRNYFIARGMPMSSSNLKQAQKPEGADTIHNPVGTAPGIAWDVSEKTGKPTLLLTFPGVPKELYAMWEHSKNAINRLQQAMGEQPQILVADFMHFFSIGESKLGEMLADLMQSANPTVAPYVGKAEVKIRVAAKADSETQARAMMQPIKDEILKRCSHYYYGENDIQLEQVVGERLLQQGLSLSVAESCTGGLISHRLTNVPGSSAYMFINMVTYGNIQKTNFIGVQPETLKTQGAVSAEVAAQMAEGIQKTSGCNIGLSTTGIAGPTGESEEKPVGLCYIGISEPGKTPMVKKVMVNSRYSREDIKHWFSQYALYYLWLYLQGQLTAD